MLSLFPELFDWSWFVPFFFRMFLAWYFIAAGYALARMADGVDRDRFAWAVLGTLVAGIGGAFLAGIFVQVAGAAGFVLGILAIALKRSGRRETSVAARESSAFYTLLALVSLSLVFLGPGPWAVDLPL